MKVNEKMGFVMDKELKYGLMGVNILENGFFFFFFFFEEIKGKKIKLRDQAN